MSLPKIIGLSGTFASGKDTLAQYLVNNFGYEHISTGDIVRKEAEKRYGSIEREVLRKVGNELRSESGASVLVEIALSSNIYPLVISGIRTLGEARALHEAGGVLLFIDATPEIRYERMRLRQRDQESMVSFKDFLDSEKKEMNENSRNDVQNISALRKIADITLDNSTTSKVFFANAIEQLNNDII